MPQSIWYFTDALFLGFRVVRPLNEPTDAEKAGTVSEVRVAEDATLSAAYRGE